MSVGDGDEADYAVIPDPCSVCKQPAKAHRYGEFGRTCPIEVKCPPCDEGHSACEMHHAGLCPCAKVVDVRDWDDDRPPKCDDPFLPCRDGDACPDARRYGKIHPAPEAGGTA